MFVVTGGAGFIGSAMVWKLNQIGITDILIVDELGSDEKWKNLTGLIYQDYNHKTEFLENLHKNKYPIFKGIIHLGAISATTETDADLLIENNVRYSQDLALHSMKNNIRLIYASSAATYGDGSQGYSDLEDDMHMLRPLNMYGYSKQLFDIWAYKNDYLNKITGLKFFNVFGPNEYHKDDMTSVVYKAFHQIKQNGKVRLFKSHKPGIEDGNQSRDFVYVKDCLEIMTWLLDHPNINGIFNVGTGHARSFKDLVTATFKALNQPVAIEYIDMPEHLRGKYQYFTQADMHKLTEAGCPVEFKALEDSVYDYVNSYLNTDRPYFDSSL